jgi:hypothetical protein
MFVRLLLAVRSGFQRKTVNGRVHLLKLAKKHHDVGYCGYIQFAFCPQLFFQHLNVRIVGEAVLAHLKTGKVSNDFPRDFGRSHYTGKVCCLVTRTVQILLDLRRHLLLLLSLQRK